MSIIPSSNNAIASFVESSRYFLCKQFLWTCILLLVAWQKRNIFSFSVCCHFFPLFFWCCFRCYCCSTHSCTFWLEMDTHYNKHYSLNMLDSCDVDCLLIFSSLLSSWSQWTLIHSFTGLSLFVTAFLLKCCELGHREKNLHYHFHFVCSSCCDDWNVFSSLKPHTPPRCLTIFFSLWPRYSTLLPRKNQLKHECQPKISFYNDNETQL